MDPKQQSNQPNQNSGTDFNIPEIPDKGPLDSNQAADLIRHQLNAIYGEPAGDQAVAPTPVQESSAHFNPFSDPTQQVQAPQASVAQQAQSPQQPAAAPYYNPYHKPADAQPQPSQQPGAAPGTDNYRNNYSSFVIPGSQPQAAPHTPQVTEHTPAPTPASVPVPTVATAPIVNAQTTTPAEPIAVTDDLTKQVSIGDLKDTVVKRVQQANKKKNHSKWKPLYVSLMVGLLFLGLNYNEVALAQVKQYISPGDSISTPVILDPSITENVGKESKIIIPKINLDVPVIYDVKGYNESQIQEGLERGVVHYGTTALPGEKGNNVIVGHSSNNYFNSGEYKFAFVLLFRLEKDDTFILHHKGQRYIYKVFNKQVIDPNDFSLVQPTDRPITTLITCTPPGTSWKRLVIQAEQISPSPLDAAKSSATAPPTEAEIVPGNAPSFWSRIFN